MSTLKAPFLSRGEQTTLYHALHYMKIHELKQCCLILSVPDSGTKSLIIERIMSLVQTGIVSKIKKFPASSLAKNYPPQPINKNSLMLYGSYKNNAQARAFFKKLIGPHFHFTAFGIDWLNERWLQGTPPTYQEFAHYWISEINNRIKNPAKPKQEWAYINFLQHARKTYRYASKDELMYTWKNLQKENAILALGIIKDIAARIAKSKQSLGN